MKCFELHLVNEKTKTVFGFRTKEAAQHAAKQHMATGYWSTWFICRVKI